MERSTIRQTIEDFKGGNKRSDKRIIVNKSVDTNRKPILRIYKPDETLGSPDTVDGDLPSDYGSCRVYGEHSDWMLAEANQSRSPPTSPNDTTRVPKETQRITRQFYDVCESQVSFGNWLS